MKEMDSLDGYKKTKYWNYMLKNFEAIDNERKKFNREFTDLLKQKTDEMTIVLKTHLILEYYIDKYIKVAYPTIQDPNKLRLSFSTKLRVIDNKQTAFGMYSTALVQFNALRNKFAHNLEYQIQEKDTSVIISVMDAWNDAGGYERTRGCELIEQFVMWVCASIHSLIIGIEKETKSMGIAGYLEWLDSMQKPEETCS